MLALADDQGDHAAFTNGFIDITTTINVNKTPSIKLHKTSQVQSVVQREYAVELHFQDELNMTSTPVVVESVNVQAVRLYDSVQVQLSGLITQELQLLSHSSLSVLGQQRTEIDTVRVQNHSTLSIEKLVSRHIFVTGSLTAHYLEVSLLTCEYGSIQSIEAWADRVVSMAQCTYQLKSLHTRDMTLNSVLTLQHIKLNVDSLYITERFAAGSRVDILATNLNFVCANVIINGTIFVSNKIFADSSTVFIRGTLAQLSNLTATGGVFVYNPASELQFKADVVRFVNQNATFDVPLVARQIDWNTSFVSINGSLEAIGAAIPSCQVTVNGSAEFQSGYARETRLQVDSLVLRSSNFVVTFELDEVSLPIVEYTAEQETVLQGLLHMSSGDPAFGEILNQVAAWKGTFRVMSGVTVKVSKINATTVLADGYVQQPTGQLEPPVFGVSKFLYLAHSPILSQPSIFFSNAAPMTTAYLRIEKSIMVRTLSLFNSDLLLSTEAQTDKDAKNAYSLTTMQALSLNEGSSIRGEFGVFTQYFTVEQITLANGSLQLEGQRFTMGLGTTLHARRLVASGQNVSLLGNVELWSDDLFSPILQLQVDFVELNSLWIRGQNSLSRQSSCCGGSSKNLGGCSQGVPQHTVKFDLWQFEKSTDQLSGFGGDNCGPLNGGAPGGSAFIEASLVILRGVINASGEPGQMEASGCAGSGAGGSVYISASTVLYTDDTTIEALGGDCAVECTSGGAGSSGQIQVDAIQIFKDQNTPAAQECSIHGGVAVPFPLNARDGNCTFEAHSVQHYCTNALTKLDENQMVCTVPIWVVIIFIFFAAVMISLVVYLTVCFVSKCRNIHLDDDAQLTDVNEFLVTADMLAQASQ